MTDDAAALIAGCQAFPDDDTARLAYLDCLEEEAGGPTPYTAAVREFYAKCLEPRRYEKVDNACAEMDGTLGQYRRALPGWREWLGIGNQWFGAESVYGFKLRNWTRLVPSLWQLLSGADRWRRRGATVEVETTQPVDADSGLHNRNSARLTFARGWLARVEFRSWRCADALLPAILADQPFAEAGIRGQPGKNGIGFSCLRQDACGPAFDLVRPYDRFWGGGSIATAKLFIPGPKRGRNAPARARAALSCALIARARSRAVPTTTGAAP